MIDKQTLEFYKSAQVTRWHNKPDIPAQTNADHSFGMLLLLIKLHPSPSANLMQAVIRHDLGEVFSGDFPHDAKKAFPELKEISETYQSIFELQFLNSEIELLPIDKLWLKLLDQLEPLYYMYCHGIEGEIFDRTLENAEQIMGQIENG